MIKNIPTDKPKSHMSYYLIQSMIYVQHQLQSVQKLVTLVQFVAKEQSKKLADVIHAQTVTLN